VLHDHGVRKVCAGAQPHEIRQLRLQVLPPDRWAVVCRAIASACTCP
jgi:hypothetical protein